MDDPTPVGKCLGCKHIVTEHVIDGKKVRAMEYDVCDFMKQCVTAYKEACRKPNMKLRRVDTPFIQTIDGEGGDAPHPLAEGRDKRRSRSYRERHPHDHPLWGSASALGPP